MGDGAHVGLAIGRDTLARRRHPALGSPVESLE